MIKDLGHLRTLGKCRKHEPQANVFYISLVFSNARRVLSQILPCVCSVTDHRRCQNEARTSLTHSAFGSCAIFCCCSYHILTRTQTSARTQTIWSRFQPKTISLPRLLKMMNYFCSLVVRFERSFLKQCFAQLIAKFSSSGVRQIIDTAHKQ